MPVSHAKHLSDDELERYSLRKLPESRLAAVEEHIFVCDECRRRLTETDEYVTAMRQALIEMERKPVAEQRPRSWLSRAVAVPKLVWAAALAALVLLMVFVPGQRSPLVPYEARLQSWRGETGPVKAAAPAERPLALTLDTTGLPRLDRYVVAIADSRGQEVFVASAAPTTSGLILQTESGLAAGQYWVRIHEPAPDPGARGELLREFGLRVQ